MANEIIGYNEIGEQKIPIFSGPCQRCGGTNYGLSTSGPDFCGACAIGRPVEEIKLRRELAETSEKYMDCMFALALACKTTYYMTDKMRERGQAYLDNYLDEAKRRGFGPPNVG